MTDTVSTTKSPSIMTKLYEDIKTNFGYNEILATIKSIHKKMLLSHAKVEDDLAITSRKLIDKPDDSDIKSNVSELKVKANGLAISLLDVEIMENVCNYLLSWNSMSSIDRKDVKNLMANNNLISTNIESLTQQIGEKEAQLVELDETMSFWDFMTDVACQEMNDSLKHVSLHDLFRDSFDAYDSNLREKINEGPEQEKALYKEFRKHISDKKTSEAIKCVKKYIQSNKFRLSIEFAYILILLSNYCRNEEYHDEAVDALLNASKIIAKQEDCKNLAYLEAQVKILYIFAIKGDLEACASFAFDTLRTMSKEGMSSNALVYRLHFLIGYSILETNEELAWKIMELSIIGMESHLDSNEYNYAWMVVTMAKILNETNAFSAALMITCDGMQVFVEKSSGSKIKNSPIYELAAKQSSYSTECRFEDLPLIEFVPLPYQEMLNEMRIAFIGLRNTAAAHLIDTYLNMVSVYDSELVVREEDMRNEMRRITELTDKDAVKTKVTLQKKPLFVPGVNLVPFLSKSDEIFEFKSLDNISKAPPNSPSKILQQIESKLSLKSWKRHTAENKGLKKEETFYVGLA